MSNKTHKVKTQALIVISAAVVVLAALLILGTVFGDPVVPEFLRIIFRINTGGDEAEIDGDIPDILHDTTLENVSYFDYSAEEILTALSEATSYKRRIRIISSYGETRDVENYRLSVDGKSFRAVGESSEIVYDGENLYMKNGLSEAVVKADTDVYSEIGFTSLGEVKQLLNDNKHKLSYGTNERTIKAVLYNDDGNIGSEYEISLENGLVVTEYHYRSGEIYRAVVTDSVTEYNGEEIAITKG